MTDETRPTAPESVPKYIAEGLPKQDDQPLRDLQDHIEALLEYRRQSVEPDHLPADAEPVDASESRKGTVVKEKVTCGDDSCHCADADGDLHGPYLYRYYYADDGLASEYIGKPADNPDIETA